MADPWDQFPDAPVASAPASDPWAAFPDAQPAPPLAAASSQFAPPPTAGQVPPPTAEDTYDQSIGKRLRDATGRALGAPVDAVNNLPTLFGREPYTERPFGGGDQLVDLLESYTGGAERSALAVGRPDLDMVGAPLGQRTYSSFLQTPEAKEMYLDSTYGPQGDGWYYLADRFGKPTDRVVVRDENGKESLFNPPGVDMGDVVGGTLGASPEIIGGVAGAFAGAPSFAAGPGVGIPATAATSAIGAQLVGEPIYRLFEENRAAETVPEVAMRAGGEAVTDFAVGALSGGLGNLTLGAGNIVRAPFADSASQGLAPAFRQAADRLGAQGYDIKPLPSEAGAGGFMPRLEGFLEKLPGSSETMAAYRREGDAVLDQVQRDAVGQGDPRQAGFNVVDFLEAQRGGLEFRRDGLLNRLDNELMQRGDTMAGRQGPLASKEQAGDAARTGLNTARDNFRSEAGRLYDAARAAPGGTDAIVDITPLQSQVAEIRANLPPEATRTMQRDTGLLDASGRPINVPTTVGGGPSQEFTPDGLRRFLSGADDIAPNMSLDQARQMRTMIYDAIDDKTILPGVPERYLSQLGRSLTQAIEGSVERAGSPELRDALTSANTFYRENADQFSRQGVSRVFREPTQPGFQESNTIVPGLLTGAGKPGVIRDMKATMGESSPEWATVRRNAWEEITGAGRSETLYGRKVVKVDALAARLDRLDDETVRELFGADADQLRAYVADLSNRMNYLDADALSPNGTQNVMASLKAAAELDGQIARDYRQNVIAPFLRGEDGSIAKMKSSEFVPWLSRNASPADAKGVMERLTPEMRKEVEEGVTADIIQSAIAKQSGGMKEVLNLLTGEAPPASGSSVADALGAGFDSGSREQAERIAAILPQETRETLRDLAVIVARREERDATTQAIGGLAAGAATTAIVTSPIRAAQAAVVTKGLAMLITNPGFRRWVSNTKRTRLAPEEQASMIAAGPISLEAYVGAAKENENVRAAIDWIEGEMSQIDESGERVTRPPDDAASWEEFFREQGAGQ